MAVDPKFILLDTSTIALDHTTSYYTTPGVRSLLLYTPNGVSGSHGYPLHMLLYCETVESIAT